MFEASWFSYIAAISARVESTRDIDVLHSCLDALAYGSTIAIQLSLETEWKAFVNVLAKITFIEKNRAVAKAGTLPKRLIQVRH
jgi:Sec7-like guanine-nucleotide exchange factor